MQDRKIILSVLLLLFTTSFAFCQSEALKPVVNNLAFYKQKKELTYLSRAKKSIDSLITTHSDSLNMEKNVYKAVVYSSILYADSLNKLNQPINFFSKTTELVEDLSARRKANNYREELNFAKLCLANVYIRRGFEYMGKSDFINSVQAFQKAQKYAPSFSQLNAYIAYSNTKLGNLQDAAKYYNNLNSTDTIKAEYIETASNIYKSLGDTARALQILQKGRNLLPDDKLLLLDEANIYNNKKDYKSLEPLLGPLLDMYPNNADIAFVAANCYDHLGNYNKAEKFYLHALEINGAAFEPTFNIGLLYFKLSTKQQGDERSKNIMYTVQWLEKANEISPNNENCLQVLKLIYTQIGNKTQIEKIDNKLKQLTNQ